MFPAIYIQFFYLFIYLSCGDNYLLYKKKSLALIKKYDDDYYFFYFNFIIFGGREGGKQACHILLFCNDGDKMKIIFIY